MRELWQLLLFSISFLVISCNAKEDNSIIINVPEITESINVKSVSLNKSSLVLKEGEYENLIVNVEPTNATNKNVIWSSNNLKVASVSPGGTVMALKEGSAMITCKSEIDSTLIAECEVTVVKNKLKVLLVGSSFGVNTISMFPVLASHAGIDITCGLLYSGSASIGVVKIRPLVHLSSMFARNADFGWYKKFSNGSWEKGTGEEGYRTYQHALQDEQWDIILFQRGAEELKVNVPWSDMQTSCLQQMIEYTRNNCDYEPTILFVDGLANSVGYGGYQTRESQNDQTRHIIETAQVMKSKFDIDVIPVGVALQNARNTSLSQYGYHNGIEGDGDLASDTQHLDAGIGYYVTGATLFEYILNPLFGISIKDVDYIPVISDVQDCWVQTASIPSNSAMFNGINANNIGIAKQVVLDAINIASYSLVSSPKSNTTSFLVEQKTMGCTSSFMSSKCENTFFSLITPEDGKRIDSCSVIMDSEDITSSSFSTFSYNDVVYGIISIPAVTGDITIELFCK